MADVEFVQDNASDLETVIAVLDVLGKDGIAASIPRVARVLETSDPEVLLGKTRTYTAKGGIIRNYGQAITLVWGAYAYYQLNTVQKVSCSQDMAAEYGKLATNSNQPIFRAMVDAGIERLDAEIEGRILRKEVRAAQREELRTSLTSTSARLREEIQLLRANGMTEEDVARIVSFEFNKATAEMVSA